MKRTRCQAFVESKGERCKKSVRWRRKYCWWHYPKAGPLLGAFLGVLLTLLFNGPLERILSAHWPFHYLDRTPPTTIAVSPNVGATGYADPNVKTFSVLCRDDYSGLDQTACEITLFLVGDNVREPLDCRIEIKANRLDLTLDRGLAHGQYVLRTVVCDRAKNRAEREYPFVISESDIVGVNVHYEEYEPTKHNRLFADFIDRRLSVLDSMRLYVYHFNFHNKSDEVYCEGLHWTIQNDGIIFCWPQEGSIDCRGVASASMSESFQPRISEYVFTQQQQLTVEEMAPQGFVHCVALVGFDLRLDEKEDAIGVLNHPDAVQVFGSYIANGYGRADVVKVNRAFPIARMESTK